MSAKRILFFINQLNQGKIHSLKMRPVFSIVLIFLSLCASAQKEDYIWHLGLDQSTDPGVQTMEVNFNKGPFEVEQITTPVGFDHKNHAICDENGDLLFYTNEIGKELTELTLVG